MYTLSKNIRLSAFIIMALGIVLFAVDYMGMPKTIEDVAAMEVAHGDGHGGGHGDAHAVSTSSHGEEHAEESGHAMSAEEHLEHTLGEYQNKPCLLYTSPSPRDRG